MLDTGLDDGNMFLFDCLVRSKIYIRYDSCFCSRKCQSSLAFFQEFDTSASGARASIVKVAKGADGVNRPYKGLDCSELKLLIALRQRIRILLGGVL